MKIIENFDTHIDYGLFQNCQKKFHNALNCIECCQKPYYDSDAQTNIDYTCPQKRKIYVTRYAPTYISEVEEALRRTENEFIRYIFQKKELNVASIGGGPGTDIAAFNKWLSTQPTWHYDFNLKDIRYLRVDVHEQWNDVSHLLIHLHKMQNVSYAFYKRILDISNNPLKSTIFESFDVIILSYFISEIDENNIHKLANHVSHLLSIKTLVVVNDINYANVIKKINSFLDDLGVMNPMSYKFTSSGWCGEIYPDEIKNKSHPKLSKNSVIYNVLI